MDGPNEKDNKLNVPLEDFAMRKGPVITGVVLASLVREPPCVECIIGALGLESSKEIAGIESAVAFNTDFPVNFLNDKFADAKRPSNS